MHPSSDLVFGELSSASAQSLVDWALLLIVATVLVVFVYRSMQKPRLVLRERDGKWRAAPRDVVLYVITMPLLLFLWWAIMAAGLTITPTKLTPAGVLIISGAIVLAVRVLAHVWKEPGHELAKTIPLTLVTITLITQSTSPDPAKLIDEVLQVDVTNTGLFAVIGVEYAVALCWYWLGVRILAPRGVKIPGVPHDAYARPQAWDGDAELRSLSGYFLFGFLGLAVESVLLEAQPRFVLSAVIAGLLVFGFSYAYRKARRRGVRLDASIGCGIAIACGLTIAGSYWILTPIVAVVGAVVCAFYAFTDTSFATLILKEKAEERIVTADDAAAHSSSPTTAAQGAALTAGPEAEVDGPH